MIRICAVAEAHWFAHRKPKDFYRLPNGKILSLSKLKEFADDVTQNITFDLNCIENIVEKGKNQHFLRFPRCFQKDFFPWGYQKLSLYDK